MTLPDKWGQGALFAFSALDGTSYAKDELVGILSGDKLGVRFFLKTVRELALVNLEGLNPVYEAVTSDLISVKTAENGTMGILFADAHLVIGKTTGDVYAIVNAEGRVKTEYSNGAEVQDTGDGQYTAILREGQKFAFAYGHSAQEAASLAKQGLALDFESEKSKKLAFYCKYALPEDDPYGKLYLKCLSSMKTQLHSPEGSFHRIWSTPDRLPHKRLWLWDSVYHSIGFRNIDPKIAEDLILALFDVQREDGLVPHSSTPEWSLDRTQPPIIAWGAYLVYQKSRNRAFLQTVFEKNKRSLLWCQANRRDTDEELYTWLTIDDVNCRCGESGMDNSSRFDTYSRLQAIDFSCFMANETRYMQKIADLLGLADESQFFANWYQKIKDAINDKLWCKKDHFYYDYDRNNQCLHKVASVASFLPLFAGICDAERAQHLYEHLTNPDTFYTEFPIPTISKQDATFGTDMWRGPVWLNYNYMIISGLAEYGFADLAAEIQGKTFDVVNRWYAESGVVFEFFDCENRQSPRTLNRKGPVFEPYDFRVRMQSIRDYGWSNTLLLDMLHNR